MSHDHKIERGLRYKIYLIRIVRLVCLAKSKPKEVVLLSTVAVRRTGGFWIFVKCVKGKCDG